MYTMCVHVLINYLKLLPSLQNSARLSGFSTLSIRPSGILIKPSADVAKNR